MKPAVWYLTMIIVGFFYIYVTAIQYIKGQETGAADGLQQTYVHQYDPQYYDERLFESNGSLDFTYHNHKEMTSFLRSVAATYPNLTALYSIGKSAQGRDLWVLVLSSSPYRPIIGQPNVKYVGNMHGNEAVGREMLLHLIEHLVTQYAQDAYVRWLLDNTRVHILPSMNPDGFSVAKEGTCQGGQGRYNSQGFDLNRNFPDYFKTNNKNSQPESEAVKLWIARIQFVISANIHGGALVASYPFDNSPNTLFQQFYSNPSLTPDDDVFRHLAETYSFNHATMHLGLPCKPGAAAFSNGTTNGAQWYPLTGGMQDYNYVWHGCMDITLEISCCKYPRHTELTKFWQQNKKALVRYLGEVHRGVRGFVMDPYGQPIEDASLKISGRDVGFTSTKYGEYWRVLLPGQYKIETYAEGYLPRQDEFYIEESNPTLLNITLFPDHDHVPSPSPTGVTNSAPPRRPIPVQATAASNTARQDYRRRPPHFVGGPTTQEGSAPFQQSNYGVTNFFGSLSNRVTKFFSSFG
ncbi:Peptidase M14 carboxypeptidase A [Trinorchestia longiramus]|nr:Peptidase M14 carboxypeptidase A [Trinorchestia longiramus]